MIDENKLIEELNRQKYILTFEDSNPIDEGFNCGIDKAIQLVESQPKVGKWISVEERLPEQKGEYLVTYHPCYRDDIDTEFYNVGIDNFRGKTSWAKSKYQKVIAWQPLPEPYEVKDND